MRMTRVAGVVALAMTTPVLAVTTPALELEQVATLARPVLVTHTPDPADARLFVLEQHAGTIRIIKDDEVMEEPFLVLPELDATGGHKGVLGLAFHPQYATNGYFYVHYTKQPTGRIVIERFQVTDDPDVADPLSAQMVIDSVTHTSGHRGGWIDFSPIDGYLYIPWGDQGPGGVSPSQDIDSLFGKILRLDVDGDDFPVDPDRNYAIPGDNPFVGVAGADEIWVTGVRQPWRSSFDPLTGDLYIADVGWHDVEEITILPGTALGGENFGWPCMEGHECSTDPSCDCENDPLVDPIFTYGHPDPDFGAAIIGGYVYRGTAIPELDGAYIFADCFVSSGGRISLIRHDGTNVTEVVELREQFLDSEDLGSISSFGRDNEGELYLCDVITGGIFRIVADDASCPWDTDQDGVVGFNDLLEVLAAWGTDPNGPPDFDGSGTVDFDDLLTQLGNWGPCP